MTDEVRQSKSMVSLTDNHLLSPTYTEQFLKQLLKQQSCYVYVGLYVARSPLIYSIHIIIIIRQLVTVHNLMLCLALGMQLRGFLVAPLDSWTCPRLLRSVCIYYIHIIIHVHVYHVHVHVHVHVGMV